MATYKGLLRTLAIGIKDGKVTLLLKLWGMK